MGTPFDELHDESRGGPLGVFAAVKDFGDIGVIHDGEGLGVRLRSGAMTWTGPHAGFFSGCNASAARKITDSLIMQRLAVYITGTDPTT